MIGQSPTPPGRGTASNPANRFEAIQMEPDADWDPAEDVLPRTHFYSDHSQTIISRNESPDVGFQAGLNPYRGCEHGCMYCYARPKYPFFPETSTTIASGYPG